ncbi:MAG: PilZ domain-containing protein [Acidobacteria bacterium]|nr:PilZ domain-containing protein [Acidobacteriota bacterium]
MLRPQQGYQRRCRRIEIRYGRDQPRYVGYSRNVSESGMMVGSTRVFAPGTILMLEVKLSSATYVMEGIVIWARAGPVRWLSTGRIGMGIALINPPEDFLLTLHAPPPAAPPARGC